MANPARPVDGQVISTTWGLAVADSVVRVYANAAARDADLAGVAPAELLGQVVMLTGTGELLTYAGPLAGWRPPWSTAWGAMAAPVVSSAELNLGGTLTLLMSIVGYPFVAGRRYQVTAEVCHQSDFPGFSYLVVDGVASMHRCPVCTVAMGEQMSTFSYEHAALTTRTADVYLQGQTIFYRGSMGQHRLACYDVGPAANPTAVILDANGVERVDRALLAPEHWANYPDVEG